MRTAHSSVFQLVLCLLAGCAPDPVEIRRVELSRTDTLPAMTIDVPAFLGPPRASRDPEDPRAGYSMVGADGIGTPDGFLATVHIEVYRDQPTRCFDDDWTAERREGIEVWRCPKDRRTAVVIPRDDGNILCMSLWQSIGDLTPTRRTLAEAIDASCPSLSITGAAAR